MREGYKETEIGVIPVDWDVVQIRDIGNISTSSIDKKIYPNEDLVNMVNYMDVYSNHYKEINSKINFMEVSCNKSQFNSCQILKGDVLFTPSSETADDIGFSAVVNDVPINTVHSYHLVRLRFTEKLSLHFKKFIFNNSNVLEQFTKSCQGTTRKTLKVSDFQNIKISLPPLKEQEKIAEILSTADDKIDAIASQIKQAETLKKGLLQKLLTEGIGHTEFKDSELGKIPVGWETTLLDNIAQRGTGHTPNKKIASYWNGGIKWVSLSDSSKMDNRYIHNTDKEISFDGINNSSAVLHPKNTVILVRDAGVGKSGILAESMAVSQHFITWICNSELNYLFLYYWLQTRKSHFEHIAIGSTIKTIGMPYFKKLKIPFPPLEEQKQIATILSTADEKLEVLRAKKEKYETLKQGLMQKLLTGEVRVKV